jgi:hypothetical protein
MTGPPPRRGGGLPRSKAQDPELVGHSHGGFVITYAATGNVNEKALVYIDAFIPDLNQRLIGLRAGSGSCLDPTAHLTPSPSTAGSISTSAQKRTRPTRASHIASQTASTHRRLPCSPPSATRGSERALRALRPTGVENDSVLVADRNRGQCGPPALQEATSSHAGAHISTVKAGHLSLITRPEAVTKIILTAIDATT